MSKNNYIKNDNRKYLIGYLVLHVFIFALISGILEPPFNDFQTILSDLQKPTIWTAILLIPFCIVLDGFLGNPVKEFSVFWRIKERLPGHRAFSVIAKNDSRIDMNQVSRIFAGYIPDEPQKQNSEWYSLYKKYQDNRIVYQAHKAFLLTRDMTALTALLLPTVFIGHLLYSSDLKIIIYHILGLFILYLFIALSASNYGKRFVANVIVEAINDESRSS
jgi:hypothetical protein